MKRLGLRFAFAILLFAHPSEAKTFHQLITQKNRPTMKEVITATGDIPHFDPIAFQSSRQWLNTLIQHGGKLIAALEKTFPGATFAFLGRDSQLIGDLVEAFYLSIGQDSRVVRLGMSKATFQNCHDNDDLLKFLADNGFPFSSIEESYPYIIVDTVSGGYGKQGRALIDAVYESFRQEGGDPSHLLRKVNMFGLIVSTFNGIPNNFTNAEQILASEEDRYRQGLRWSFATEHTIITFPDPGNLFNEAGYEHHTSAWHGSYGALMEENGKLRANPGPPFAVSLRANILAMQSALFTQVKTPAFLESVKKEAKALGGEFPMTRPLPQRINKTLVREEEKPIDEETQKLLEAAKINDARFEGATSFGTELDIVIAKMKKKIEAPEGELSENGKLLFEWLRKAKATPFINYERLGYDLFVAVRKARKGLRLRSYDLRFFTNQAFLLARTSLLLAKEVKDFVKESKAFRDMMLNDDWVSDNMSLETYRSLQRLLQRMETCSFALTEGVWN